MRSLTDTQVFNRADNIIAGWYWAMPSSALKRGQVKPFNFFGRELAIYRGEDLQVVALDAYCPHMGAHLAEGNVEGNAIRCRFHYWKYDAQGKCIEIPCQANTAVVPPLRRWPVEEKFGLIWIWAGRGMPQPLPFVPELEHEECESRLANRFVKACHPHVMMINAIDAQHFNSVHHLPVALQLEPTVINDHCIKFTNTTQIPRTSLLTKFLGRFYKAALTYTLCYFFASTGTVTIGPDFLHFHLMFALRPTAEGHSIGQTILLTRRRRGGLGKAWSRVLLWLTRLVGAYFAKGDTRIFKTIKFNFRTPIKADAPIIRFIEHTENQATMAWGLPLEEDEKRVNQEASQGANPALTRSANVRASAYLEREAK
ncbi:MAG: aromatic ring-hydroxylating dioxygenase subunit alpha [Acidobacteria bacterium]|nr:aromatic ring-hydroxylating dioxygenase subunit alpha [Acidobacteriota bacterium]